MRLPLLSLSLALLTVGVLIQALELLTSPYDDLTVREGIPTKEEMKELHEEYAKAWKNLEEDHISYEIYAQKVADLGPEIDKSARVMQDTTVQNVNMGRKDLHPLNIVATRLEAVHKAYHDLEIDRTTALLHRDFAQAWAEYWARLADDYAHAWCYARKRVNPEIREDPLICPKLLFEVPSGPNLGRRKPHVFEQGEPDTIQSLEKEKKRFNDLLESHVKERFKYSSMASGERCELAPIFKAVTESRRIYDEEKAALSQAPDLYRAAQKLRSANFEAFYAAAQHILAVSAHRDSDIDKTYHQRLEKVYRDLEDDAGERIKNWGTTQN